MEHQLASSMDPNKVKCPHCGGNNCFEESSPVKSGDYVNYISDTVKSYMCVSCGYTTTTLNTEGSALIKEYEEATPELIKDMRWIDPLTNLVWYPMVLNFPSTGIVFPNGTNKYDWKWTAAPSIDIPIAEQKKYPIPGEKNKYYEKRISLEAGRDYPPNQFHDACEFVGFIKPKS